MLSLTETHETPGAGYLYRAWISHEDFVHGMERIVCDVTYANFKNEVARREPETSSSTGARR